MLDEIKLGIGYIEKEVQAVFNKRVLREDIEDIAALIYDAGLFLYTCSNTGFEDKIDVSLYKYPHLLPIIKWSLGLLVSQDDMQLIRTWTNCKASGWSEYEIERYVKTIWTIR